ncbi:3-keto-disaccharide hydrolase [Membranihabitans maritimus]|uniref:3-keto-disaccharide hydrolase n=1 Tax=Membranihabitans maritimus TaxID=2904244 RepID=UPI001F1DA306|nr:DUF1080 domain-containing protein [Membranihabitans maritimus]
MTNRLLSFSVLFIITISLFACSNESSKEEKKSVEIEWQQLFNGEDLTDWTPKIRYQDFGNNFNNTFSVNDGKIVVNYDQYDNFEEQFGHLFYKNPYAAYFLSIEYRFVGDQIHDGPGWAIRNSGAMLHCQDPATMGKDQDFPISIEGQLLGGDGESERTTSNLCTPGTNVVMDNELFTPHCVSSSSKTYHGEQWVRASFLVLKDSLVRHYLEGEIVLEYTKPQIGGGSVSAYNPEVKKDGNLLTEGYISLQSESHPIEFRKVELVDLEQIYENKPLLEETVSSLVENEKILFQGLNK